MYNRGNLAQFTLGEIALSEEDFDQPERRKMSIVLDYARANWVPFTSVTVSSVIFSFLLDEDPQKLDAFLVERGIADKGRQEFSEHIGNLAKEPSFYAFRKAISQESAPGRKGSSLAVFRVKSQSSGSSNAKSTGGPLPRSFSGLRRQR